jgi:hypothetical protein
VEVGCNEGRGEEFSCGYNVSLTIGERVGVEGAGVGAKGTHCMMSQVNNLHSRTEG